MDRRDANAVMLMQRAASAFVTLKDCSKGPVTDDVQARARQAYATLSETHACSTGCAMKASDHVFWLGMMHSRVYLCDKTRITDTEYPTDDARDFDYSDFDADKHACIVAPPHILKLLDATHFGASSCVAILPKVAIVQWNTIL